MERDEIIMIFNSLITGERKQIEYSKGYKIFDEIYDLFSKEFNLQKKEDGIYTIVELEDKNEKH